MTTIEFVMLSSATPHNQGMYYPWSAHVMLSGFCTKLIRLSLGLRQQKQDL